MPKKTTKDRNKELDLQVRLDIADDPDKIFKVTYRPLTRKEENAPVLVKASTCYRENFAKLATYVDDDHSISKDIADLETILKATPEDDDEYNEILLEKVRLKSQSRKIAKQGADELKRVKEEHPEFKTLAEENSKISILELKSQLAGGDDAKEIFALLKKSPELATMTQIYLSEAYREEMQGK